jgi:hypothetical protein
MPGGPFDPTDPSTYPAAGFRDLDRAVRDASQAKLKVMIDVAFWAPRWAVRKGSPDGRYRYAPDPRRFGQFAEAVARRYSGRFPDPASPRRRLPAVRLYTTWNEPNQTQFLQPQWRHADRGWIAESPHLYRALHNAAHDAIKRVDPGNQVLIGGTAAVGSDVPGRGGVPPMTFVRSLACVDPHLRPLTIPDCRGFTPLKADGYAHHPYSLDTMPGVHASNPDEVPLADTDRLEQLLHKLYEGGRITTDLPVYDTEYGYESNPPDPFSRFSPEDQARFIGWSTFMAWSDPDTRMFAQFLLRDSSPGVDGGQPGTQRYWRSYETGLYYSDGRPKPAVEAFRLPFWAQRMATGGPPVVLLFGKVRPAPGRQLVRVDRLEPSSGTWHAVQTFNHDCSTSGEFLTDDAGYFLTFVPFEGNTTYRLAWWRSDGRWEYGVPIPVDDAEPVLYSARRRHL